MVFLSTWLLACSQSAPSDEGGGFETPGWPDAPADMAVELDGAHAYASMGIAGFPFVRDPQTISLWLEYGGGAGTETVVALRKDFASGVQLGFRDGVPTAWRTYSGATFVAAPTAWPAGAWHHLAYVYDGGEMGMAHLYVDGREIATGVASPNNRTPTSGWLGSVDGTKEFFQGRMDEVRIWTVARTAEEIGQDMARTAPATDPALVAYFTFNESGGPWALDRSGNGNHAVLGDGVDAYMPHRVLSPFADGGVVVGDSGTGAGETDARIDGADAQPPDSGGRDSESRDGAARDSEPAAD